LTIRRLVSLGDVVVDIVTRIGALPQRGADVLATEASITTGGGAFNTMVAATRQGLPAMYGGAHGTGPFGDLARSALAREGIRVALEPVPDADTGFDVAMIEDSGERTFVTVVGAEAQLTTERIDGVEFETDDAVHISGYGLLQAANRLAIVGRLADLEGTVLFDPGPLGHEIPAFDLDAVLIRADWWSGNRREAQLATGLGDPAAAAHAIAARSRGGVIVRLGPDGCIITKAGKEAEHIPGYAVDVIDTNGAGDAHVGAFIAALGAGASPRAAAQRANAVAAIAITRRGPATSPDRDETDAFLRHTRVSAIAARPNVSSR
jgi:sugar/nucleoside kinase (ribokinase family)